ncbi:MAG TPA: class I SAM-dependent methyltransferase, partial [Oscillospiraceae bacterium]|nr:class I SAM-dependent methyltransferase [Oscillospiraceae bacterium]
MDSYSNFARFYDLLTGNISYKKRAEYFNSIIEKFGGEKGILLDLACGTGSLSEEMARLGYDVVGVDSSPEMLTVALDKKIESGLPIQYLCQDMTELDLFGTVDAAVCALDSINHLPDINSVRKTFEKVSLFSNPGAIFVFDANTPYKHREVLANNVFVYDLDEVFCVWQNSYDEKTCTVEINLDFFEKN